MAYYSGWRNKVAPVSRDWLNLLFIIMICCMMCYWNYPVEETPFGKGNCKFCLNLLYVCY